MINFEQFKTKAEVIEYLKTNKDIYCQTNVQVEKYLREHLPKECYYQDKIIKRLRELIPTSFVWKAAAGPYSRQGIPDICAVINGKYYGFEVKRPFIGVLSKMQEQTIKQIQQAGGKAYVVTYPSEVTEILQEEIGGIK
ncbi:MAG: VRR-NUC domain-containing protein [Lachnospiraceae bacterium]